MPCPRSHRVRGGGARILPLNCCALQPHKRNGGRPRKPGTLQGAEGEMAQHGNTVKRREFPERQRQGGRQVLCGHCLVCSRASGLLYTWQGYRILLPQLPRPYPAKVAGPTAAWAAWGDLDMLKACGWLRLALPEHLLWLQCSSCSLQAGSAGAESPFAKMTQQKM